MFVLCLLAGQPATIQSVRANENTGLLGARLTLVEKSHDLFTFFHLACTRSEIQPDHRSLVAFKPSGEAFRPLVTLTATADEHRVIERLRLEVDRTFIDDTRQGIFAADLVKSFLGSVGTDDEGTLGALAREIHARSLLNAGTRVLMAQPTPTVSKASSAGYQVFAGKTAAQTISNRSGSVQASLQNTGKAGAVTLEITLSLAGHG